MWLKLRSRILVGPCSGQHAVVFFTTTRGRHSSITGLYCHFLSQVSVSKAKTEKLLLSEFVWK